MKRPRKKYQKPSITKVVLNPAQAVLSVCSTTTTNAKSSGSASCRGSSNACVKSTNTGDSAAQC